MSIIVDENEPLFDVDDYAFEPRDVQIRKGEWINEEFEVLDFLGRGKFGEVKRCRERKTGREFAAKFILAPRPQDKEDVRQEVEVMKKLQHKRLLQLYDAFCLKNEMCLILEIIQGGELFDRVILDDFILTERACVVFMRQICEGVEYMHNKNIIHLDLKPENILCLTRTGNRIKIIDFGLAREYDPTKELRVLFGTPEFMAPEVVQYEPIAFSTDMWSVGVICYVLLSGLSPFMGDCDGETLTNVIKASYDFNYPEFDEVSDNAKDLIAKLLVIDKRQRLTATECLDHPWLRRKDDEKRQQLQLSKRRLKRFVYRRKWQKVVNAIIALKRMGVHLENLRNQRLSLKESESILPQETIFGWDAKRSSAAGGGDGLGEEASKSRGHETSPDTDAADSGVGGSLKDTLGELALDSSGTAAPASSDGISGDIKARDAKATTTAAAASTAGAAGPCRSKRFPKAAGAAAPARDTKSEGGGVTVERGLKHDRFSLNSESSRGDRQRKTGPDKPLSSHRQEKTPETIPSNAPNSDRDTTVSVIGKKPSVPKVPPKEKSPETSKRKKHSSTETPVLKKSRTPDRVGTDSESIKEKTSDTMPAEKSRKERTPEPSKTARGIGRVQAFGKENLQKSSDKVSSSNTLDVVKPALEKAVSTPAEVSLKLSPKMSPTSKKRDLIHKKPNLPSSGGRGKSPGKSKAKDDSELTKDSRLSSHKSEIERKVSFRKPKRVDRSFRDSIHLKHKIAPTIQTRNEDKKKKDDKKIEDNPTERPKSWLFENNPFRKQDANLGQNSPKSETGSLEKRKRSVGFKPEMTDSQTEKKPERAGKEEAIDFAGERKDSFDEKPNKPMSDQNTKDKQWKKKNRLSEFPSVSNPNVSLFEKPNGMNSNESTLERRPVKRNRIMIEPPLEKLEKIAAEEAAAEAAAAAKSEEKIERKVNHKKSKEQKEPTDEKVTPTSNQNVSASNEGRTQPAVSKKEKPEIKPKPEFLTKSGSSQAAAVETLNGDKPPKKIAVNKKEKPELKPKPDFLVKNPGKMSNVAEIHAQPVLDAKPPKRLPNIEIYPIGSKPGSSPSGGKNSVDQSDTKSSAFGATFIKSNPFKLVSFGGGADKPSTSPKTQKGSMNLQLQKSDPPENTASEPSKPPTPTKQKSFSLFRKGSDKRKDRKSPTPDGKAKGLFRRGSDKAKNKSGGTHANKAGRFGSGPAGESSSKEKGSGTKLPNPTVDVEAANSAEEASSSASPRDESDLKILTLMKKGKGMTSAGSTPVEAPPRVEENNKTIVKKGVEPEQQYKSRFAAMKAMWHKGS